MCCLIGKIDSVEETVWLASELGLRSNFFRGCSAGREECWLVGSVIGLAHFSKNWLGDNIRRQQSRHLETNWNIYWQTSKTC